MTINPHWKQIIGAFLIGAVIGVFAGSRFQRMALHRFWQHGPDSQRVVKRLTGELGLDDSQQQALKKLIDQHHADTLALQRETSEKFDAIRMTARDGIRKLLRPDQMDKFNQITARWDARHKKMAPDEEPNK